MPPLSGPRAVQVTRSLCLCAARLAIRASSASAPDRTATTGLPAVSPDAESGGAVTPDSGARRPKSGCSFRALWRVLPPLKHLPDEKRVWIGRGDRGGAPRAGRAAGRRAGPLPSPGRIIWLACGCIGRRGCRGSRISAIPGSTVRTSAARPGSGASGDAWSGRRPHADALVFVNEQTADRVMAKYPAAWRARSHVVPQVRLRA